VGANVGSEDADGINRVVRDGPSVASGDSMIKAKRFIVAAVGGLAVGAAVQAAVLPWTVKAMRWQASTSTVTAVTTAVVTNDFTIRFLTGTFPTTLTVGLTPSVTNAAQYDPGDGVWRVYSARTITLAAGSSYISFRGAWTNSSRTYQALFSGTFNTNTYTCQTEGAFSNKPVNGDAYRDMFLNAKTIVSFTTNPIPLLTGAPAANMYRGTFNGMTGLTNMPAGIMDTRGLTGSPAGNMFDSACLNMSGVKNLPDGFMNTASLTGAPASSMFYSACNGMSGVTNLPVGFLNTSGLAGAPASDMFRASCQNMSGVTNLPVGFLNTSGLTGAPSANMFYLSCNGMSGVTTLPVGFMNTASLTGAPSANMFNQSCFNMSGVTNLPDGFLNTSKLTGAPTVNMFYQSCRGMSGVTTLPVGFLDTRGLTGAPAADMFFQACLNMSGVTNLPAGFLASTGLTGAPSANMYNQSCQGMSGVIAGDFNLSSNLTFATTNIASSMPYAFSSMTKWTGTVYWGTNRIYDAITNPATDANVFQSSTNVPGFLTMGGNWK
jgi:hypothetical protein